MMMKAKKKYEVMENKFKKLLEEQKQKLEQVEPNEKGQSAVDQDDISSLDLFKKRIQNFWYNY